MLFLELTIHLQHPFDDVDAMTVGVGGTTLVELVDSTDTAFLRWHLLLAGHDTHRQLLAAACLYGLPELLDTLLLRFDSLYQC